MGYFTTDRKDIFDYTADDPVVRYIERWRLQKKDPSAEVSEPVEPITYWIENSTPKEYRDAVRAGIEMWEPAFRKAGFVNGIVAKQMPEDADWDPADIRFSVVRWSADENVGFAIGPSRADPRTGELFDADITMQANFVAIMCFGIRSGTSRPGRPRGPGPVKRRSRFPSCRPRVPSRTRSGRSASSEPCRRSASNPGPTRRRSRPPHKVLGCWCSNKSVTCEPGRPSGSQYDTFH